MKISAEKLKTIIREEFQKMNEVEVYNLDDTDVYFGGAAGPEDSPERRMIVMQDVFSDLIMAIVDFALMKNGYEAALDEAPPSYKGANQLAKDMGKMIAKGILDEEYPEGVAGEEGEEETEYTPRPRDF